MTDPESDWQELSELWKSAPPGDAEPLRRIVRAGRLRLAFVTAGEIAVVAAFALLSLFVARDGLAVWEVVWLTTLWAFTAVAVTFALWNRRDTWNAVGDTVTDYLRLSRLRCHRQRRTLRFVIVCSVAETAAVAAQLAWMGRLTPIALSLLSLGALGVLVWCALMKRRLDREVRTIDELQGAL
jgi:hypothetical protein